MYVIRCGVHSTIQLLEVERKAIKSNLHNNMYKDDNFTTTLNSTYIFAHAMVF